MFDQTVSLLTPPREPDTTYFELPHGGHSGERAAPSTSTPSNATEVCMDIYHMRDMNDNVMVGRESLVQLQFNS